MLMSRIGQKKTVLLSLIVTWSPRTILESNGFKEVCINAFPIPNKEKEINISI